jgi:hypothetical protein
MTPIELLKAFDQMPKNQQVSLAQQISDRVATELFEQLNLYLPDLEISEAEVMKEVKAVRYAKHPKN